jgi:von Willebrand factor type A domain
MITQWFQFPGMGLVALLAVAFAVIALYKSQYSVQQRTTRYGDEALLRQFASYKSRLSRRVILYLWILCFACLAITAVGPQIPYGQATVPEGSRDVMVMIDTSTSMRIEDYRPFMPLWDPEQKKFIPGLEVLGARGSRLDMAKKIIQEQIEPALRQNRLGLVNYQGDVKKNLNALIRVDLTLDFDSIHTALDDVKWIDIGNALAAEGSKISTGLEACCLAFDADPKPGHELTIVVLSDGGKDDTDEEMQHAFAEVKKRNIHVIFVGLGGDVGRQIPVYKTKDGKETNGVSTGWLKAWDDYKGAVDTDHNVLDQLHFDVLQQLAKQCDGMAIKVSPGEKMPELDWAYKIAGSQAIRQTTPIFQWFLIPGCLLLVVLSNKVGQKRPNRANYK